jgi:acyl transferase domain-containing protein/enoyl-CoA hydratase/carnithine racemase/acyl carrier protein
MQTQLKQIYEDLLAGTITKPEALERVRLLSANAQAQAGAAAVLAPCWQEMAPATGQQPHYTEHVVVLCGVGDDEVARSIPAQRCLHWPPAAGPDAAQSYRAHAGAAFALVQEMLRAKPAGRLLLQVAVADEPALEMLAGLSALFKSATQENPQFSGQLLQVPSNIGATALAQLLKTEAAAPDEALVRHRDGTRQVRRWTMAPAAQPAQRAAFREDGVYLITGGAGALGMQFAGEILRQAGHAKVVLSGRSARSPLSGSEPRISYVQADLDDAAAVRAMVDGIVQHHGRLDGVLHAAGMIADNYILNKPASEFDAVLAPKVAGTLHLDQATAALDLDFLVLFSSIAGALGNAGQSDYATANAFMDRYAAARNARLQQAGRTGHTLSLNWSLWQQGGMRLDARHLEAIRGQTGLTPLQTASGLQALHRCLAMPGAQYLVTGEDNHALRQWLAAPSRPATAVAPPTMTAVAGNAMQEHAERLLCQLLSAVLKVAPHQIDPQAQLEQYGIDSIMAMSLTTELQKSFGPLPKTLFFEYQTLGDLAAYMVLAHGTRLGELLHTGAPASSVAAAPTVSAPRRVARQPGKAKTTASVPSAPAANAEAIAIIGLSGRYPESVDLASFWRNLRDGKDCVGEVPAERWNWRDYYSEDRTEAGRHYSRWGGFISGIDEFDAQFFNISPREAKHIDPQERLFLQHAWMAIEDAGYTRAALETQQGQTTGGEAGVYVGVMYSEYQMFGVEASERGQRMALNGSIASIANRVSYCLNLHGPSMTLDTMCSSSLTAIHLACQDLRLGRTSVAIAGGVNVSVHPNKYLLLSSGQFISSDGQCQSFGEGGNGYIPGEGVGVVVLKRLSDAQRDGDHIHGVIRGSALSHGGRTNGYSVPNPRGQANAIRRALDDAGVDAARISYVEAHGTGTKLGDPIEIAALNAVYAASAELSEKCPIGSVKSNIGHCESAAGMAALTKVLLQMKHGEIVPSLHSARLNPNIDFAASPFVVNQVLQPWVPAAGRTGPRMAGISSFGAGGSNAHLVIEQHAHADSHRSTDGLPVAILLSARTAIALEQKARDLLAFLDSDAVTDLAAIAYTLQVGREAMEERLGLLTDSRADLAAKLQAYLSGETSVAGVHRGDARSGRETLGMFHADGDLKQLISTWFAEKKLAVLVELWGKGVEMDWSAMYGDVRPPRVSLPTYPFAKDRHWVDAVPRQVAVAGPGALHTLVQRNTSTLDQQSYDAQFSGAEFFFGADSVLAEAAYLEMARAAVALAQPGEGEAGTLELRDTVWGEACTAKTVSIVLSGASDSVDIDICGVGAAGETVYCQTTATRVASGALQRVDLTSVRAELPLMPADAALTRLGVASVRMASGQLLAEVSIPAAGDGLTTLRVLIAALRLGAVLRETAAAPESLDMMRFAGEIQGAVSIWLRDAGDGMEVDVVDAQGQVQMQLRGLSYQTIPQVTSEAERFEPATPLTAVPVREIALAAMPSRPALTARGKPTAVALASPALPLPTRAASVRVPVRLKDPVVGLDVGGGSDTETALRLIDLGGGVFDLRTTSAVAAPANDLAQQLVAALNTTAHEPSAKVLVIHGDGDNFLFGAANQPDAAQARSLYAALVSSPLVVIAAMDGEATGTGWLAGALCDFMICSEDGRYGYRQAAGIAVDACEAALLHERFGAAMARQLLAQESPVSGAKLRAEGWSCPVVAASELNAHALKLAGVLAGHALDALQLLKQHLARHLVALLNDAALAPTPAAAGTSSEDSVAVLHVEASSLEQLNRLLDADMSRHSAVVLAWHVGPLSIADNEQTMRALQDTLAAVPVPVVVALESDGGDLGWLAGLMADACIHNAQGMYAIAANRLGTALAGSASELLTRRVGGGMAREILLAGVSYAGAELHQRIGALTASGREAVLPEAMALAESLGRLGRVGMQAWRRGAAYSRLLPLSYEAGGDEMQTSVVKTTVGPLSLVSSVVSAVADADGVVLVRMEDREARNMFSPALVAGMEEVFAHIAADKSYKAVVLTGYDAYFASGGTKADLLAIQAGTVRFTDNRMFDLALRCEIPVIAAMQGHGIGAGWAMGMFADFSLFSERAEYVSPYMNYGFTPGAGATLVFPDRIGYDLARETLLTGQHVTGRALRERGMKLAVLPQDQVLPAAMALAQRIAAQPRALLTCLKRHLASGLRQQLEQTCQLELAMHERTFVGRADTLELIRERFAGAAAKPTAPANTTAVMPAATQTGDLQAGLKALLAQELQLRVEEVDDDMQFVDMGLDSVSGVTWMRKINEQYGTDIDATRIYSHPTLRQLSQHVSQQMPQRAVPAIATPAAAPVSSTPVLAGLRTLLAQELQLREDEVGDDVQFVDMGLDSVSGVTWMRKINEQYSTDIDATRIYSHPTLKQLAAHVGQHAVMPAAAVPSAPAAAVVAAASPVRMPVAKRITARRSRSETRRAPATSVARFEPIAVVGMAGQFPQAQDVEAFWQNIAAGKDCISEVPAGRWNIDAHYRAGEATPGKTNGRWMGALENYDCFDPLFFNISPAEAESMDPQQRLFLQACWNAIEHAGYSADALSGSKCGVFVGVASGDYLQDAAAQRLSAPGFTGSASSILAARISYFLNLQGPCLAIDTACSSSLVAIANACDSLVNGNSDTALAGGVYVMAGPEMMIKTAQAGMLSADGRCFAFDQRANGFVPGEAVATVMLKRLSDAQRDGDAIYSVIRGWGVNQDGKTNGITAPNPDAQARLQRDVYTRFGIDPAAIGLIEAHGTGTKLGDPIEVQALKESFGANQGKAAYCALGSVKSNIGHCLTAAGATGFIKLVQALRYRQLPPTVHFHQLNEHIRLDGSPFYVNGQLTDWTVGARPRLAAVSSFGFSGTNAHVVLEEYVDVRQGRQAARSGQLIFPLSAKTGEQLRQRAADLLAMLAVEGAVPELADIAYTLQTGRVAMEARICFTAASIAELRASLSSYLSGIAMPDTTGAPLAARWLQGDAVVWPQSGIAGRRIALPGYPFAKERYWIDADTQMPVVAAPAPQSAPVVPAASVAKAMPADGMATLLVPEWHDAALVEAEAQRYVEHIVILCGTSEANTGEVATLIPADRCVHWPLRGDLTLAEAYQEHARSCFQIVQGMLRRRAKGRLLVQIAVADEPELALLAGLAGMFRSATQENPQFAGQVIMVPPQTSTTALVRLLKAEATVPEEVLVRHRHGARHVQRWTAPATAQQMPQVAFKEDGVYLITGGTGALGMLFAGEILRHTRNGRAVLTGRTAPDPLAMRDDRLSYIQLDLCNLAEVRAAIDSVIATHGRLDGILHSAGMIADNFILNKPLTEFDAVLAPKVAGTLNLELATADLEFDFLALFSSIAGALGNAGQADYAAANGFMDQFAAMRNARLAQAGRRGHTLSLNWSLWQHGGMRIDDEMLLAIRLHTGMEPLQTAAGVQALHRGLALPGAQCLVVEGDIARLSVHLGGTLLAGTTAPVAVAANLPVFAPAADLRQLHERTLHQMKQLFGGAIKLAPSRVDEHREFSAYGIDSLTVTRLNTEFDKVFGRISKTLVFEYKTLAALSAYFVERHEAQCLAWTGLQAPASAAPAPAPAPAAAKPAPAIAAPAVVRGALREQPIAIIGMSGIFPQAATLEQYWDNLRSGKDSVTPVPAGRWPLAPFYEPDMMRAVELGKSYSKWGGFVDQFDEFDALFFGIAPRDAMSMDPQERLFLQSAWHALESSGYTRADLRDKFRRQVGVFAGITKQGFNLLGSETARRERQFYPHTSFGSLANRLSYFLDINGPSMPIDTMCSSSLTAIHEACEHLRRGDCDLVFAGAVNLYTHPSTYIDMAAQYALSPDGRSRSFGAGANGFVPGEGAGVMLLRPLDAALADGDLIQGVILGTHVNHGGKTNGYTVPNPRAQAELIARAIDKAGISARDISYIEAHGTGTALGDPIEIEGLRQAFARSTDATGYCRIGSAKSNIGHLEAAAGMAGLSKILLQMKHKEIVPSLHAEQLNPSIDFDATPFVVNTGLTPWEPVGADGAAIARVAGISAFGAGGANAHVIVQEFVADGAAQAGRGDTGYQEVLVPLSARTPGALREVAASLLGWLEQADRATDLAALAYTLQVGREAMEERACFVTDSVAGLAAQLRAFAKGESNIDGMYVGQTGQADGGLGELVQDDGMQSAVATWLAQKKLARLAQWWCRGLGLAWATLYDHGTPRRLALPGYPFARDRHWPAQAQQAPVAAEVHGGALGQSIDDIVNLVDSDVIDTDQAIRMLDDVLGR